jgi:uncharacterized protein
MRLNLRKLMANELDRLEFSGTVDLSHLDWNGEQPLKEPVRVEGSVENHAGVLSLDAKVHFILESGCARCGKQVSLEQSVRLNHLLAEEVQDEDSEDIIPISEGEVDLTEYIVSAIVLDLPMRILCSEDCKGLCPKCGKNLNEGDCGCDHKEIDPRLSALGKLLN